MMSNLSILDNILLPAIHANKGKKAVLTAKAKTLMKKLSISGLEQRRIAEVSGGQLQRACICRSLMNEPEILFADEPTGALNQSAAFRASYGIWIVIDWYDCFFLDWVLFANVKRIRLPGTEHMDKAYHQKKYYFVHSVIGMIIGLIPCLLCGIIAAVIN